jgi:hypothetical protein
VTAWELPDGIARDMLPPNPAVIARQSKRSTSAQHQKRRWPQALKPWKRDDPFFHRPDSLPPSKCDLAGVAQSAQQNELGNNPISFPHVKII